ncbi:MAG: hypothetical protein V1872_11960 [bacterium]
MIGIKKLMKALIIFISALLLTNFMVWAEDSKKETFQINPTLTIDNPQGLEDKKTEKRMKLLLRTTSRPMK